MKAYYKVILFVAIACAANYQAVAQIYVGGTLTATTTWTSNENPYIVVQDVIVPKGISLTILPGVIIKFQVETCIKVYGTLVAQGIETSHILFTSNSTGPDIQRWSGIKLYNTHTQLNAQGNYLSGTIISEARLEGTTYSFIIEDSSSVLIEKCEMDNSAYAVFLENSNNNIIRNCTISNSNIGIFIPSNFECSYNRFSDNVIHHNSNVGFFMNNNEGRSKYNIIDGNHFDSNPIGIYIGNEGQADPGHSIIRNNIISNSSTIGLKLYQDSSEVSDNIFYGNLDGIRIVNSKFSRIANNLIFSNQEWGLLISGDAAFNTVESNNIYENLGGVLLSVQNGDSSRYNSIIRNAIHNNHGIAIRVESSPQAGIQFNNIYNNGAENCFINLTQATIHAEYNWWGTTDTLLINKQIYDVFDNHGIGQVIYKPFAGAAGSTPPISAPRNVLKRLVGNQVEVVWSPNQENDLGGYKVYSDYLTQYSFANNVDVHNTTHHFIDGISIFDTIAVTAYDSQANGISDQFEGHESAYTYAVLGPYAGADTSICYNNAFAVSGSTAFDYSSLLWASSGDGSFNNSLALHPLYTPGFQDKANGEVTLTLTIISEGIQLTDDIHLLLLPIPVIEAGANDTIVQDSAFYLAESNVKYCDSILWTTGGDGQFNNENLVRPTYFPGTSDIDAGQVKLTLNAFSPCGSFSDELVLDILPSFSISGKIHAGNMPMRNGTLSLLRKLDNGFEPMRSRQIQPDGKFHIGTLKQDSFLIYVTPDPIDYPDYLPTYYAGQLSWKDAYLLPLHANTYDLDIYLVPRNIILPAGLGSISGTCTTGGGIIPSDEAQNLTVLLLDGKGKNILGFAKSMADGTFIFPNLPFGVYILQAEKAGYESVSSPQIQIVPSSPDISGVLINLLPHKMTIAIEIPEYIMTAALNLYPNPATDLLHVTLPKDTVIYGYSICDATGRLIPGFSNSDITRNAAYLELDIKNLAKGYYTLTVNTQISAYHCRFLKL
jgi:parallel beta-helix repeat protein